MLLLNNCLLLLPLFWGFVTGICIGVQYLVSFSSVRSSGWEEKADCFT